MTKISEEILLEEVKAEYTRQLTNWNELNHKSHNFLQLNGLLLSIIFIGINFAMESINYFTSLFLLGASFFIIISILILARFVISVTTIKEIKVELSDDGEITGKEKEIILSLIKVYNISQKDIISKHAIRVKNLSYSIRCLLCGLLLLSSFIFAIYLPKIVI